MAIITQRALSVARAANLPRARVVAPLRRHLQTGGSTGTHENDGTPETIESEKQRNLTGKTKSSMDHAPEWNAKLASTSEVGVKADKDTRSPEELQKATVSHLATDASDLATEATRLADKAKNVAKDAAQTAKNKLGA